MSKRKQKFLSQEARRLKSLKQETIEAGSNDVILEKQLRNRRVTSQPTKKAAPLIQPNAPEIAWTTGVDQSCYFQYHYDPKCYLNNENRPLSDLIEYARNSVKAFTFRGGDMCSEDAKEFFTIMGHSVKTLTLLAVDNVSFTSNMNLTTILTQTPNLERLVLDGGSYYDAKATDRLMLPSLKYLEFACRLDANMAPGIKVILNGAPKLERIDGVWRLDDLEPILTMNKIHTIKQWFATEDELALSQLLHLNCSNEVDTERLWQYFKNILDKKSIQKLILTCSKFPVNAAFPKNMSNVKELVLMPNSNPKTLRHFPLGINLCSTFPRLHTLSFYDPLYKLCNGGNWSNCFPLSDKFEHVKILRMVKTLNLRGDSTSIRMLRKMKKFCPNVQNLEIHLNGRLNKTQIVRELCSAWQHLKKLSINLDECKLGSKDNLDWAFTGIDPESLECLSNDPSLTDEQKLVEAENTRDNLSIGNIAGLTQLDIKFRSDPSNNKILVPFTTHSGKYAFKLMSKLVVRLHYLNEYTCNSKELSRYLDSIRPFVIIIRR